MHAICVWELRSAGSELPRRDMTRTVSLEVNMGAPLQGKRPCRCVRMLDQVSGPSKVADLIDHTLIELAQGRDTSDSLPTSRRHLHALEQCQVLSRVFRLA